MAEKTPKLSVQQRRFIAEYLVDFNALHAAGRAGYSIKNTGVGTHLLALPQVATEIETRCLKIQAKLEVTGDDVRRGLARIATDPRMEAAGGPSFRDRILAWKELGKLLGLYTHKIQVTGSLTLVDLLLAAERKAEADQASITQH
jgi:phage terminase small subunit